MLLGSFFTIADKTTTDKKVVATLDINAQHKIFEGHFPGQPVVPGVCMMQMIKEMVEAETNNKLQLRTADHLKFLAVINPVENPSIIAELSYDNNEAGNINVSGKLYKNEVTFLKFKGSFIVNV
ncbi:MAG: 3-hydroxyacyl-ACP dehydratase [Ferruginibacter sp.]